MSTVTWLISMCLQTILWAPQERCYEKEHYQTLLVVSICICHVLTKSQKISFTKHLKEKSRLFWQKIILHEFKKFPWDVHAISHRSRNPMVDSAVANIETIFRYILIFITAKTIPWVSRCNEILYNVNSDEPIKESKSTRLACKCILHSLYTPGQN